MSPLRAEPDVFGLVASDPTVSRLIDALDAAGPKAFTAIRSARAEVRCRVWELAGMGSPAVGGSVTVDIDGVLALAHSEKQDATVTWKKTFGHRPLVAFVDHGQAGSGKPVAALLRPAWSNTASDHIETARLALAPTSQAPAARPTDTDPHRLRRRDPYLPRPALPPGPVGWLSYSVGMTITDAIHQAVLKIPKKATGLAPEEYKVFQGSASEATASTHSIGRDLAQVNRP